MIDIENEQLTLLTKASAHVPGRPHLSTLLRWTRRGVKGVKLETVVVGGRRFTSLQAIHRFITSLSEPATLRGPSLSRKRRRELEAIDERLDAEGIK